MDLDWLWRPFSALQEAVEEDEGETSKDAQLSTPSKSIPQPKKINDHVYEIHKPKGRPSMELVFFHGLQLDPVSSRDAHINTWITQDKSACWLTWLLEALPEARILTISYDGAARKTDSGGRLDMYVTTENLVHALTGVSARVGQDGCPVVLVGHCLGGLVMKEVCSHAHRMASLMNHPKPVENFLENVKGFFFYSTPHHGSLLADTNEKYLKAPLMKALRTLETHTGRRNEEFHKLRISRGWQTSGVVGLLPVTVKLYDFKGVIIVPEASARSDMDDFYAASVDHYNICRPINKRSSTYQQLSDFACRLMEEWAMKVDVPSIDDGNATVRPELSPLAIGLLKGVDLVVTLLNAFGMFTAFGLIANKFFGNNYTFEETVVRMTISISLLWSSTILSMLVTPFGCVYLLRFCITKRWVQPGQLAFELDLKHPLIDKSGFSTLYRQEELSDQKLQDDYELDPHLEWTAIPDHDRDVVDVSGTWMTSIPQPR